MGVREGLQSLSMQYSQVYQQLQQDIAQVMKGLGQYPMAQRYAQLVSDFASGLKVSARLLFYANTLCHRTVVMNADAVVYALNKAGQVTEQSRLMEP